MPDTYRPTLFDFLAFEALRFYTSGEQAGARAEDAFELTADSPIFASVEDFLAWDVKTPDAESLTVRAIRLYQNLLKFHLQDKDPSAFLDADLERLHFGFNKAVGEEKNTRYKAALQRFVERWGDRETSIRARFLWASVLQQENDLVAAHRIATQGGYFLQYGAGWQCYNLLDQIEAPLVEIATERVWNEPWPLIQVRYRNLTKVHFRLVRED